MAADIAAENAFIPDINSPQTADLTPFADAIANEIAAMVTGKPVEVFKKANNNLQSPVLTNGVEEGPEPTAPSVKQGFSNTTISENTASVNML